MLLVSIAVTVEDIVRINPATLLDGTLYGYNLWWRPLGGPSEIGGFIGGFGPDRAPMLAALACAIFGGDPDRGIEPWRTGGGATSSATRSATRSGTTQTSPTPARRAAGAGWRRT